MEKDNLIYFQKEKGSLLDQILASRQRGQGDFGLCGGRGICGRCRVRFPANAPLPSASDRRFFSPGELREGYRLACTARPAADCRAEVCFEKGPGTEIVTVNHTGPAAGEVSVSHTGPAAGEVSVSHTEPAAEEVSVSHTEPAAEDAPARRTLQEPADNGAGQFCAVDLGTTTIVMQLVDRASGNILYTHAFQNPQRMYGIDVLSRLSAAADGRAALLRDLVRDGLEAGLREMEKAGCPAEVIVSGNTAMGHLLLGYPTDTLGQAPFLPYHIESSRFVLGGLPACFLPGISAFVGADIVSGLYVCGMAEREGLSLFIDLGTNGEMAVGNRDGILCSAAAAGSAFEGGISAQMTGTDVTALAFDMLREGIMDGTGLLRDPWFTDGYPAGGQGDVLIRQQDIRNLQMAKAAVCAGVSILLDRVDGWKRLERVYLAGGFGYYLDVKKAVGIGLIPEVLQNKCTAVGNTSLAGVVRCGRDGDSGERLARIVRISRSLNLAEQPEFGDRYVDAMAFKRM